MIKFEKAEKAADLLKEMGVDFYIHAVVTQEVAENIDKIYDFYKEKGWVCGANENQACISGLFPA